MNTNRIFPALPQPNRNSNPYGQPYAIQRTGTSGMSTNISQARQSGLKYGNKMNATTQASANLINQQNRCPLTGLIRR